MSLHNYIKIRKTCGGIAVEERMDECEEATLIAIKPTLIDAIKEANRYMEDNVVEHGLDISDDVLV